MKTFTNRFSALVQLTNVGRDVVAAKITTSMQLASCDRHYVASRILDELVPDFVEYRQLYDGDFVIFSCDDAKFASNMCVSTDPASIVFDASVELEDGLVHNIRVSLEKSDSVRRDHIIRETRSIILRGTVSVEVDDDEASEE